MVQYLLSTYADEDDGSRAPMTAEEMQTFMKRVVPNPNVNATKASGPRATQIEAVGGLPTPWRPGAFEG